MINSLYVHIPFCDSICNYCDFTKLQYFHDIADKYLDSLNQEIKSLDINTNLETIYIGGGTPTSLSKDQLIKLLEILKPYSKNIKEYTIEANPESLALEKIKILKKYGINRISLGVESTNNSILKAINRLHTFDDVIKCISFLRDNGIKNINMDLILGLPNVTKEMFKKDLENILKLNPNHISIYSLTVHENTKFYLDNIKEPDQDFSRDMYDYAHEYLLRNGYVHYEISNFAKPGYESIHNMVYWKNEQYYGVGLGASGYIDEIRYRNTKNLTKYLNNNFEKEIEKVNKKDLKEYQIMLNLRTNKGIDLEAYKNLFNEDLLITKKKEIEHFFNQKLLFLEGNCLIPTYEGMMVLDRIILDLF